LSYGSCSTARYAEDAEAQGLDAQAAALGRGCATDPIWCENLKIAQGIPEGGLALAEQQPH
jgi:hypothetical protein